MRRFTLGMLTIQLLMALYFLATTPDYIVALYIMVSGINVGLLGWQYFDAYIESKRPYSRSRAIQLNGGDHTANQWEQLKRRMGYRCAKCQGHERDVGLLTKDHIIPISLGGLDNISNIQPLCKSCNSQKGARIVDYR